MNYEFIKPYADELVGMFKPFCKRIEIAGSVRRQTSECKDVELVAIPDKWLLQMELIKLKDNGIIRMLKDGPKYKRFKYKAIVCDLFLCIEKNFGYIYVLRTGSRVFNIRLIAALKRKGFHCEDGFIRKNGLLIETPEEDTVFNDLLDVATPEAYKRSI